MGKKTYIGVDNSARKGKKAYFGVDNVAHKVKKMYLGVNNVAHLIFMGKEGLDHYGTIPPLSKQRQAFASTTVGQYALFGGGYTSDAYNTVDTYDVNLVRNSATGLSVARSDLAATTIGTYALFGGGDNQVNTWGGSESGTVDAYDASLVRTVVSQLSQARMELGAASNESYAIFAGGYYFTGATFSDSALHTCKNVDAYNASLTKANPNTLPIGMLHPAACSVGKYVIFTQGCTSDSSNYFGATYAYDKSLTLISPSAPNIDLTEQAATRIGKYALFAGGTRCYNTNIYDSTVFTYNESLSISYIDSLAVPKAYIGATTLEEFALFAGGSKTNAYTNSVEAYNESLVKIDVTPLKYTDGSVVGETIGSYALFARNYRNTDTEVYTIFK